MDTLFNLFQTIPFWLLFVLTFTGLFLAFEGGVFLGKKHRLLEELEDRSPIGSIVAATLGLLAFVLAFTFGIAASKFDERRYIVVEEANAIGTTYLRAEYLEDPYSEEIKKLLKDYVSLRISVLTPESIAKGIQQSEEVQDQLWQRAVAVAKRSPNSVVVGLFIQSLNEVIDIHAKRVNVGLRIRIPFVIWCVLYFVTFLAIGSVGYQIGVMHARYLGITVILILTFSAMMVLIADLDRPQEGFVRVSQQALIDLETKFNGAL